ncbi:MAG: hypothetical protein KDK97_20390 [Verrucomicrobiales bacterium]|nr:hypothetical protein [Verrucomicrobiales bacterium]MCP5559401.1 hypothetical protein [Verrucomicrobiaceae bacterium]
MLDRAISLIRHQRTKAFLWAGVCALAPFPSLAGDPVLSDNLEVVYQLSLPPSAIACAPDGSWVMGVNPSEKPRNRAVKVTRSGTVIPFPTPSMSEAMPGESLPLDSISGLQSDAEGVVWMVDNGRRTETSPKIIAWNEDKQRLHSVFNLAPPAVSPTSFVSDIAVDPNSPLAFLADPASGTDAAIIVLDRATGLARRLLQGEASVQPDTTIPIPSGSGTSETRRLDGQTVMPQCGINALCLDKKSEWLYFCARQANHIYRIRTSVLGDLKASAADVAKAVETWASKPFSSSMAIDTKGNLFLTDIANRAIVVVEPARRNFVPLLSDPRLLNPDGLSFGKDGKLYFFSPTQSRSLPQPMPDAFCLFRVPDLTIHRSGE